MGKKVDFDADVKFTDDIIEIRHRNKELIETKDWGWIKNIENKKDRLWLVVNANTPFGISFPKDKLTEEELNFFLEKVKGKNGH